MPTWTNPKLVHVEPRGGLPAAAVIVVAVTGYAAWQVAAWLASVIAAVEAAAGVVTIGALAGLVVVLRRQRGRTHLDAPQWVTERLGAPRIPSRRALARPAPAIPASRRPQIEAPAVHYHLHLHAAQPAIEENQP